MHAPFCSFNGTLRLLLSTTSSQVNFGNILMYNENFLSRLFKFSFSHRSDIILIVNTFSFRFSSKEVFLKQNYKTFEVFLEYYSRALQKSVDALEEEKKHGRGKHYMTIWTFLTGPERNHGKKLEVKKMMKTNSFRLKEKTESGKC